MKRAFELDPVLKKIEAAVAVYPKAAMFELFERGYTSLFEQLISCIISIRTLDETTIPVSLRLFDVARTPKGAVETFACGVGDFTLWRYIPRAKSLHHAWDRPGSGRKIQ